MKLLLARLDLKLLIYQSKKWRILTMNENQNNLTEEISEQDINILKKVRLEKLDELKSKNANPYEDYKI